MEILDEAPHIDLYNFEDPNNDDSRYVLTSPRSLEACSRLAIKPLELIYKPLIEFQEDLSSHNIPMRTIYSIYEEHERERQNKVEMCRDVRIQVINEEKGIFDFEPNLVNNVYHTAAEKDTDATPCKSYSRQRNVSIAELENKELLPDRLHGEDIEGSLQRRRTAHTLSSNHDRIKSLNAFKGEGGDIFKAKTVTIIEPPALKKNNKKNASLQMNMKKRNGKKQRRRTASAAEAQRGSLDEYELGHQQNGGMHQNGDISSDLGSKSPSSLSLSSSRGSRWSTMKDPAADAKPIADPKLRNKLPRAKSAGTKVTARDQRILEIMMAKREEAKKRELDRQTAQRNWEIQRAKEAEKQTAKERQRRHSINNHKTLEERKQRDMERLQQEKEARQMNEDAVKHCDRQSATQSQKLLDEKQRKLREKKLQNMQRKKSQELRLEQQRQQEIELNENIRAKVERSLQRANSVRELKEKEKVESFKMKSSQFKNKQEENLQSLKKQFEKDQEQLAAAIKYKQNHAENVNETKHHRSHGELRMSTTDVSKKIDTARGNQQKLQKEMEEWAHDLDTYRRTMEKKADDQARKVLIEKKRKAAEERVKKERLQRENMKKILQQEEEYKADLEATIAMKDSRSKIIQMEKDDMIQKSRQLAITSQQLREDLRQAYATDHIDQMSKRAELENKIGGGLHSATRNFNGLHIN